VDIPEPETGLVIRYAYLWRDEQQRGLEEGQKDRPCAVVLAVERAEGAKRVIVAAITHTPPLAGTGAIAVPPFTAKRLGLDDLPQWIVTHEVNVFTWPGPDIRRAPGSDPPSIAYGHLPHGLTSQLLAKVRENVRQKNSVTVERDETT
jgi:hypothetical protein